MEIEIEMKEPRLRVFRCARNIPFLFFYDYDYGYDYNGNRNDYYYYYQNDGYLMYIW